jgi:carboxylate-amine ligase
VADGFGRAYTLGVEEELFLVDAESLEPAPVFSEVVPEPTERIKPELFACLVEATTPVCETAAEVLESLRSLRADVARRARTAAARPLASGTHPLARAGGHPIVDLPRYRRLAKELGPHVQRQLVCGLHVHVAMPDPASCLRAFEGVVPWLPVLLALSANSPFAEGEHTGRRSVRGERLLELPTGGTPPLLPSWAAWDEATRGDESRRHWDAWPRPGYGTLEVRVCDQQTDVTRSAGFAALVQALAATVVGTEPCPYDRTLYERRREDAGRAPPARAEVAALSDLVEAEARRRGSWPLVAGVLEGRPEAERQLALGPRATLPDAVERTVVLGSAWPSEPRRSP